MNENDYIAEYVKETHPEIIESFDFAMWKLVKVAIKMRDDIFEAIKNMDFFKLKKEIEKVNGSFQEKMKEMQIEQEDQT